VDIRKVSGYPAYWDDMQKVSGYTPLWGGYTESFCPLIVRVLDLRCGVVC
jgi:hypothetical protein